MGTRLIGRYWLFLLIAPARSVTSGVMYLMQGMRGHKMWLSSPGRSHHALFSRCIPTNNLRYLSKEPACAGHSSPLHILWPPSMDCGRWLRDVLLNLWCVQSIPARREFAALIGADLPELREHRLPQFACARPWGPDRVRGGIDDDTTASTTPTRGTPSGKLGSPYQPSSHDCPTSTCGCTHV